MRTTLPAAITTVGEAKAFLAALYCNNEQYHPEDDAHDVLWEDVDVTDEEANQLNKLMEDIYALHECTPKRDDEGILYMDFDPCGFLLDLNREVLSDLDKLYEV